jgi:hypothetical protein
MKPTSKPITAAQMASNSSDEGSRRRVGKDGKKQADRNFRLVGGI